MHRKWIALVAAVALIAGAAEADATTAAAAQAPPHQSASGVRGKAPAARMSAKPQQKQVNLNAASRQELKGLVGGSDEEAARIIAGRPYDSKAFLLSRQIISAARYEEIKKQVVAGKPAQPASRK
jgi:DNA uptake protein ComE-like DNA-binding protein